MRKMSFYNKEKNKDTLQALTQALANRDRSQINIGSINPPQRNVSGGDNVLGGASNLAVNGLKLGKTLFDNYKSNGNDFNFGTVGNAANNYINNVPDFGTVGNAANANIMGTAGTGSAVGDAIGAQTGSSLLGNVAPYGGIILGGVNAGLKGLNGGDWKDEVPQTFFGIDPKGSDTSQALSGAAQGAMMGLPFGGPIGAAIGGILGLGASFLDDI